MRTGPIALVLVLAAALAGCSDNSVASDPSAVKTEVKQASAETMNRGDNVISGAATTIHDPSQAKEGGSYRVTPADPNNKNFQQDPKLSGGGGG
jgi:hypothetical protein